MMIKKCRYIMVSVMFISIMFVSVGFAQDIPVLPDLGLTKDESVSQKAFDQMHNNFTLYAPQIQAFADNLPPNMSDLQTKIYALLTEAETKLGNLKEIAVYFTTESYATVHAAYASGVAGLTLDDVSTQEFQTFLEQKESQLGQAASPSNPLPSNPIPPETRSALETLNSAGALHATRGAVGKSRISILSVYVHPETFAVVEQTTVVIATDN